MFVDMSRALLLSRSARPAASRGPDESREWHADSTGVTRKRASKERAAGRVTTGSASPARRRSAPAGTPHERVGPAIRSADVASLVLALVGRGVGRDGAPPKTRTFMSLISEDSIARVPDLRSLSSCASVWTAPSGPVKTASSENTLPKPARSCFASAAAASRSIFIRTASVS